MSALFTGGGGLLDFLRLGLGLNRPSLEGTGGVLSDWSFDAGETDTGVVGRDDILGGKGDKDSRGLCEG